MSLLDIIRANPSETRRWIIKYNKKGDIEEVKMLYEDQPYTGKRLILNDKELKPILETHRKNKNNEKI